MRKLLNGERRRHVHYHKASQFSRHHHREAHATRKRTLTPLSRDDEFRNKLSFLVLVTVQYRHFHCSVYFQHTLSAIKVRKNDISICIGKRFPHHVSRYSTKPTRSICVEIIIEADTVQTLHAWRKKKNTDSGRCGVKTEKESELAQQNLRNVGIDAIPTDVFQG